MKAFLTAANQRLGRLDQTHGLARRLFIASLLVGGLWLLIAPRSLKDDSNSDYTPQVQLILERRCLVYPDGAVAHRYPPLYPMLLSGQFLVADSLNIPRLFITGLFAIVVTALSAVVLYRTGRLACDYRVSLVGAVLFMTHPFILWSVLTPSSETPFMLLLYLASFKFLRLRAARSSAVGSYLGVGALLGLSMLIRPIAIFAPGVLGVYLLGWRQGIASPWRRALLASSVLGGSLLAIAPWELWVYARTQRVILLSSGDVAAVRDGLSFNHKAMRDKLELPADIDSLTNRVWAGYSGLRTKAKLYRFMLGEAEERPLTVIKLYALKALRCWYGTDSQRRGLERFNVAIALLYLPAAALGLSRALRGGVEARAWAVLTIAMAAYFWLIATSVLSIVRYMVPVIGSMIMFVPLGLVGWAKEAPGREPHSYRSRLPS